MLLLLLLQLAPLPISTAASDDGCPAWPSFLRRHAALPDAAPPPALGEALSDACWSTGDPIERLLCEVAWQRQLAGPRCAGAPKPEPVPPFDFPLSGTSQLAVASADTVPGPHTASRCRYCALSGNALQAFDPNGSLRATFAPGSTVRLHKWELFLRAGGVEPASALEFLDAPYVRLAINCCTPTTMQLSTSRSFSRTQ